MAAKSTEASMLSERGRLTSATEDFLTTNLIRCIENPYNKVTNPQGIINMGTGINQLCADLLEDKLQQPGFIQYDKDMVKYVDVRGIYSVRKVVAEFMTEKLRASPPLNPDNIIIVNGVTSALDMLAHCLADPGDVFLCPTPVYPRIYSNFYERSHVGIWEIPLSSEIGNDEVKSFQLTVRRIHQSLQNAEKNGKKVKGIILLNPHNPLGEMYSPILLMNIMEFCKQHKLHIICDEIYAMSVFRKIDGDFHSILGIPFYPDPKRIHVLWGLSKDFCLASLRVGIVYSFNPEVINALYKTSSFHTVSSLVQYTMMNLLQDRDWCDETYFPTNYRRLTNAHSTASKRLCNMGVPVRPSYAGFVLWADFRKYLNQTTFEEEAQLNERFLAAGVYIIPGKTLFCSEPGWFRITFALNQDYLEAGMKRIEEVLQQIQVKSGKQC